MSYSFPYKINSKFKKSTAYFSMEFAIDQSLKIYSGGLGFLAGSHMRSAFDLKQNVIGIGMLWKYGYYDQIRKGNNEMSVLYQEKHCNFLEKLDIELEVTVHHAPIKIQVYYLKPEVFGTAPIFLLSTQHEDNDHLAHTITHRLYDSHLAARIAQYIVLGIGGAKLIEKLGLEVDNYHFNEAHALPAAFYLARKYPKAEALKKHLAFTTHTPVKAGNEINDPWFLHSMGYFDKLDVAGIEHMVGYDQGMFNHTLAALRLSKKANAVSKKHKEVADKMWGQYDGICEIKAITNAQNTKYWMDKDLAVAYDSKDTDAFARRKRVLKEQLFEEVADQTGKRFDPDALTVVWARRFAGYKRADLLMSDMEQFRDMVESTDQPLQVIWAGKPHPQDSGAIDQFNKLVHFTRHFKNATVLTGYELRLSALLKKGSDIWLNNPRIPLEASGTSGMTAAMNGSLNLSTFDGWMIEFGKHLHNAYLIPEVNLNDSLEAQDDHDRAHLYRIMKEHVIPDYYENPKGRQKMLFQSIKDVLAYFDSDRMAKEYFDVLYK